MTKHVNPTDKSCHTRTEPFSSNRFNILLYYEKTRIGKSGTEFAVDIGQRAIRGSKIILCCLTILTTFDVLDPLIAD